MERIVATTAISLLPMMLLLGAVVLGLLFIAGGRKAGRIIGVPFLALLTGALLLAWLTLSL
jgi:hypothetical protein